MFRQLFERPRPEYDLCGSGKGKWVYHVGPPVNFDRLYPIPDGNVKNLKIMRSPPEPVFTHPHSGTTIFSTGMTITFVNIYLMDHSWNQADFEREVEQET
jgi:hypothetical protein